MKKLLPLVGVCLVGCDQGFEENSNIDVESSKYEVLMQDAGDVQTGVQRIINSSTGLAYDFRKETPKGLQTITVWDKDGNGILDAEELQRGEVVLKTALGSEINHIPQEQWEGVQSGYKTLYSVMKQFNSPRPE